MNKKIISILLTVIMAFGPAVSDVYAFETAGEEAFFATSTQQAEPLEDETDVAASAGDTESGNDETQDVEVKNAEANESETENAEVENTEAKESETENAEVENTEAKESETDDAEVKNTEAGESETKSAENGNTESENVQNGNAESENAESEEAGAEKEDEKSEEQQTVNEQVQDAELNESQSDDRENESAAAEETQDKGGADEEEKAADTENGETQANEAAAEESETKDSDADEAEDTDKESKEEATEAEKTDEDEAEADEDSEDVEAEEDEEIADETDDKTPEYTVRFHGNGSTSGKTDDIICEPGKECVLPANGYVRTGYDFTGWNTKADGSGRAYNEKSTFSDSDAKDGDIVILYAQWDETSYSVTYVLDGGVNADSNPTEYEITDSIVLKDPKKEGAKFEGWYTDSGFKNRTTGIKKGTTGELTFYAKWKTNTYTVVYDGNGSTSGKMGKQKGLKYGVRYTLNSNKFKRTGYKFNGWNTKKGGGGKSYSDKAEFESLAKKDGATVTVYAQWKLETYSISYKLNGGKNNEKNPTKYDVKKTINLKNPTKKGYTFAGWYQNKGLTKKITKIKKGTTGNKTLYAKWKANKYTVKYFGNTGGKGTTPNTECEYGKTYKLSVNKFKRTGYKFTGWNTKKNGSGKKYKEKAKIKNLSAKNNAVVKMYAQWRPIRYTIMFNANGGSGYMDNLKCEYDMIYQLPKNRYTRTGYQFDGWSVNPNGAGASVPDKHVFGNISTTDGEIIILFAKWKKEDDEGDGKNNEQTVWNYLYERLENKFGTAGLMGNLYAESGMRPNNLQNTGNNSLNMTDEEYTRKVDDGSYTNFVYDNQGYGLAQWTYPTRKQGLLNYAKERGTSVGNLRTQLSYLWKELTEDYYSLVQRLRNAETVREASDLVMTIFERPADQSEEAKEKRARYGYDYYELFK